MKTSISIPDELFGRAEQLAKRHGLSRSELYARALSELLRQQTESRVGASFDEAYADVNDERDVWGDLRQFRRAVAASRGRAPRR
jgi:predicted transcriptional regulator